MPAGPSPPVVEPILCSPLQCYHIIGQQPLNFGAPQPSDIFVPSHLGPSSGSLPPRPGGYLFVAAFHLAAEVHIIHDELLQQHLALFLYIKLLHQLAIVDHVYADHELLLQLAAAFLIVHSGFISLLLNLTASPASVVKPLILELLAYVACLNHLFDA